MTTNTPAASDSTRGRSPWITLVAVLAGSYVFVLNGHIIGLALPSIAADLARPGGLDVDWTVTIFLLGVGFALPITGWATDRLGRRRLFVTATVVFGLGAAICVLAPRLEMLLAGRFIQGAGGGMLIPLGTSTIYEVFPPQQRGRAMSVWGIAVVSGPAIAPPIAGWTIAAAGWRWLFVAFSVVAAASAATSWRLMEDSPRTTPSSSLDMTGWALAGIGVSATVIGARQSVSWGVTSAATLAVLTIAALSLLGFAIRSWHHAHPVIEVRMFTSIGFTAACVVSSATAVGQFARINVLPVELQVVRELSPGSAGGVMVAAALGILIATPIAGWLVDRVGTRRPILIGMTFMTIGLWIWATLSPDDPLARVVVGLLINGFGTGLVVIPAMVAAMSAAPEQLSAQASSVNELNRQLSGALGLAVLGAMVVSQLGSIAPVDVDPNVAQAAYNRAFMVALIYVVAAMGAAWFVPHQIRRRSGTRTRESVR